MLPLATLVQVRRCSGLSAAQGHRDSAWGPRGTSPGAYSEPTGPFYHICLLYTTKQYKKALTPDTSGSPCNDV